MIKKVLLKNWRSHLESEFNFTTGTNALVGVLGSGKTSILNGICFGLFGTFPELQSKKLKLDEIIMRKPFEKDRAEVEVHFEVDGKNYSVKRIIEKKKGTTYSELRENSKLIEAPNAQRVTQLVEKILKINYDLFSKAIYSEQNALDYFLTIPKGKRMKKIDELLMIDKFENARANAVAIANKFEDRKIGKESAVEQMDEEEIREKLKEIKKSLENSLREKENYIKNLKEISVSKEKIEKEVKELKEIREEIEKLEKEEKGIESALEEISEIVKSLEESIKGKKKEDVEKRLEEIKDKIEKIEEELKEKQKKYKEFNSLISRSKGELEFIKKEKIEKLEKEIEKGLILEKEYENLVKEDFEKRLKEEKEVYEKLISEIEGSSQKIRDLREIVERLSSVERICPLCESKISEEKKSSLIEKKKTEIKELEERTEDMKKKKEKAEEEIKEIEEIIGKIREMGKEIEKLDEVKNELEESRKVFDYLSKKTKEAEEKIFEIENDMKRLEEEMKSLREVGKDLEFIELKILDYEKKKERLKELLIEREFISKKLGEIRNRIVDKDLEMEEKMLMELIAKEREIETRISSLGQTIEERKKIIEELEKKLNEILKVKDEVKKLDKIIKDLKIFEKALTQTQIELRSEFVDAVNYTMNKLWPTLYPYQDYVEIGLLIEEGDYVLKLKTRGGEWVNVEGVASGGERSIACLALRISFALVLAPHLRLLILDEPTANLDSKAVKELATTLRERIGEFINQTFIITHQPELEDAVTGNAYRLERDKIEDGVTKVIPI